MALLSRLKRTLIGKPIATKHAHHERLPKRIALPVFASDALSSTAYATEEIMRVFMVSSLAYLGLTFNIAIIISTLIFLVAFSYYQTIHAYPAGGGSYIVARDNLGPLYGQIAGAALMVDYVLTVSVSVSAGVLAVVSMQPHLSPYMVPIGIAAIGLITMANLRGAKESGLLFAIPTYTFVILLSIMVIYGGGPWFPTAPVPQEILDARTKIDPNQGWTSLVFLAVAFKAFSSGCAALTGIEAISDGAGAFREPTSRNASTTLLVMASLLSFMFVGTSWLGEKFHIIPVENVSDPNFKTVLALITQHIFPANTGFGQFYFTAVQVATAAILFLAANTAYADFPRLCSFVARDGYLPRQLSNLGDRLVFQNGILVLASAAALLIVKYGGDTHKLIPLYAVGVFLSFTMSQSGMVARARKLKIWNWKTNVSLLGAILTGTLTIVLLASKWHEGAYLVIFAIGGMLLLFNRIRKHYNYLANELEVEPTDHAHPAKTAVLLMVPRVHKGILQAISYASGLSDDVRALHVTIDPKTVDRVKKDWETYGGDMPLVILESPFRSLVEPIIDYIDETLDEDPELMVTVIVPEAVPKYPWHRLLHNNVAITLKAALRSRRRVVITNVRYFLK